MNEHLLKLFNFETHQRPGADVMLRQSDKNTVFGNDLKHKREGFVLRLRDDYNVSFKVKNPNYSLRRPKMATRSKKVLKALADNLDKPKEKKPKAKPKKKAEPKNETLTYTMCPTYAHPGVKERSGAGIVMWGSILKTMKDLGMEMDSIPALALLPAPLHIGQWADGSELIATHVGCCIDGENMYWDFCQVKDGKIYHINMRKMKAADLPPPPQTDRNTVRKNEIVN